MTQYASAFMSIFVSETYNWFVILRGKYGLIGKTVTNICDHMDHMDHQVWLSIEQDIFEYLEVYYSQNYWLREDEEIPVLHKFYHIKSKLFFSLPLCMVTFFFLIVFGVSDARLVSIVAVLYMFRESLTEANSVSLIVPFIFLLIDFPSKIFFFSNTLSFSLNFNNIGNLNMPWWALCLRSPREADFCVKIHFCPNL